MIFPMFSQLCQLRPKIFSRPDAFRPLRPSRRVRPACRAVAAGSATRLGCGGGAKASWGVGLTTGHGVGVQKLNGKDLIVE